MKANTNTNRTKSVTTAAYKPLAHDLDDTFLATIRENKLALIASALLVGIWLLLWANYELSEYQAKKTDANTTTAPNNTATHAMAKPESK